jgi:hypothetical protein
MRGWAGYFRTVMAPETFRSLDNWMYHKEVRYTKRAHPTKPGYWRKNRYWGRLNAQRDDTHQGVWPCAANSRGGGGHQVRPFPSPERVS